MPTMIVLVNLKEGVRSEDYERWILETYTPAASSLPSVEDWRGYRVSGLLGSEAASPCQYIVSVEINDLERLGQDMTSEEMQRLLSELHRFARLPSLCRTGSSEQQTCTYLSSALWSDHYAATAVDADVGAVDSTGHPPGQV